MFGVVPLTALLVFLGAHPTSAVAAPANDNCAGAVNIQNVTPASPFFGPVVSIATATSTGEASLNNSCQPVVSRGLWYRFTPVNSGFYTVSTCAGATTVDDTVMAIYTSAGGCSGPFVQVACNDDLCGPSGLQAAITTSLLADTTYFIVVWQYDTTPPLPGKTNVQVVVSWQTPPANDTCISPQPVMLNTLVFGSTILASNNYQLAGSSCFKGVRQSPAAGTGRDVVYWFEAPTSDLYSFKVYNYSIAVGYNLMLYVGGYCQPGATPQTVTNCMAASNRNSAGSAEEVMCMPMTAGQQVYIYVDDTDPNVGSAFVLEVTRCEQESETNNTPATASRPACGIEGAITPVGDTDFYSLGSFPAGSRAFVMVDGESAELSNFDLRITSLTDTLEYDESDNDMQFGQTSPNVAGVPLAGGPAFVRVNYPSRDEEPYRLYATVQPPAASAAPEVEPNNTVANANSDPRSYYSGILAGPAPSADVDMYQFSANEGDLVFISLDCSPARTATAINAQLALLDVFGNELVIVDGSAGTTDPARTTNNLGAVQPSFPGEALVYRCAEGIYNVRVTVSPFASIPAGAGPYLLSIARNCIAGSAGVNTAPTVTNLSVTPSIMEGGTVTLSGTMYEPDLGNWLSLVVNWGDGSSNVLNCPVPGAVPFSFDHQYLDDNPTGTSFDTFPISITATDNSGATGTANTSVTASNAPPRFGSIAVTGPQSVGSGAVLSGAIVDPGMLDSFTLSVNWGDGSAAQNFNYPAGTTSFSQVHNYPTVINSYNVSVTLRDDDNGMSATNLTAQVTSSAMRARIVSIKKQPNGRFLLQLQGLPSVTYRIDASTNLPPTWSLLGNVPSGPNGTFSFEDVAPPPRSRFYRAVSP